jgi:hypothetical protein
VTRKEDREALAARLAIFKKKYLRKAYPGQDPIGGLSVPAYRLGESRLHEVALAASRRGIHT